MWRPLERTSSAWDGRDRQVPGWLSRLLHELRASQGMDLSVHLRRRRPTPSPTIAEGAFLAEVECRLSADNL